MDSVEDGRGALEATPLSDSCEEFCLKERRNQEVAGRSRVKRGFFQGPPGRWDA